MDANYLSPQSQNFLQSSISVYFLAAIMSCNVLRVISSFVKRILCILFFIGCCIRTNENVCIEINLPTAFNPPLSDLTVSTVSRSFLIYKFRISMFVSLMLFSPRRPYDNSHSNIMRFNHLLQEFLIFDYLLSFSLNKNSSISSVEIYPYIIFYRPNNFVWMN